MPFSPVIRNRVLLWCDRHCCVCKKQCGVHIEVDHIDPEANGGSNDIENALPVCYECHADVKHYDPKHPRGTKYKEQELTIRRDQVYEEFTRHLVPPLNYRISNRLPNGRLRQLPDVGFEISHLGNSLPVRVFVDTEITHRRKSLGRPDHDFYNGKRPWHLNPQLGQFGHFSLPEEVVADGKIELVVTLTIKDVYDRLHKWLPVGFEYMRRDSGDYWTLVPSPTQVNK